MAALRRFRFIPFSLGVGLAALGNGITFYPGAECGWFLTAAALTIAGLFVPETPIRIAAAVLLIYSLFTAHTGYRHGVRYQEWLSKKQTSLHDDTVR